MVELESYIFHIQRDPNRECDCFWDMDKNANRATRLNPQSEINTPEDTDVNLNSNGDQCDLVIEKRQHKQNLKSSTFRFYDMLLLDSIKLLRYN